jgi:uncharacterized cupredoxin-like copper-binding protein
MDTFLVEAAMSLGFTLRRVTAVIIVAIVVVIVVIGAILVFEYMAPPNPSASTPPSETPGASSQGQKVTITVYSGEINTSTYGFGNSSGTITSPGPSYTVTVGSTVTVKFTNSGSMAHNWALVTEKADAVDTLAFPGSQVRDSINPVAPGESDTCTFVADKTGTYYYICQVDGHVTLGMWGYFSVI